MKLITYYIVAGDSSATSSPSLICLAIEQVVPWISMPIFLTLFFADPLGGLGPRREADGAEIANPHRSSVQRATSGPKPPSLSGSLEGWGSRFRAGFPCGYPA